MANIPLTISGIQEAKAQLAELDKAFQKVKDDPIESKKLADQFNNLSKDIDKATESLDEMNKSGKNLSATFEQIYGEDLKPMTGRIGELEDRLYELALAGGQNTQEFKDMSAEVSRLKTTIRETDKQIDLMTENKGLAVFGEGFAQIGGSLMRLDFQTAGKDAEALNNAVGNLGKMGSQALSGLGKTVGQLSKAFIKMGVALVMNPIFLIGVAVTALIAGIALLLDKLGFLQPVLDAIGYAFGVIKDAINSVVQSLKDFLDWIGLTSFAAQDAAAKEQAAYEKTAKAAEEKQKRVTKAYDQEIRLANIAGEDTTRLELQKQYAIIETAKARRDALKGQIEANKTSKKLSEEEVQALKDQLKETSALINDSVFEVKAIKAQQDKEEQDRRDKQLQKDKEAYKKRLEARKEFEKQLLDIDRQIEDLILSREEDDLKRDIKANEAKYKRLLEDIEKNEKLTEKQKTLLKEKYAEQEFEERKNIELKYEDELTKALIQADKDRAKQREEQAKKDAEMSKQMADYWTTTSKEGYEEDYKNFLAYKDAKEGLQESLMNSFSGLAQALEANGKRSAGLQKTLALVEIATSTAKAISNVIAGATAAASATGPAAPFVLAGYIASGIATVASAILSAKQALQSAPSIGGSGGGGNVGTVQTGGTATQPAQPSFNLFGQNNNGNNLSAPQDVESGQEITVKAVVSETEVTDTQNKIKKIQDLASL